MLCLRRILFAIELIAAEFVFDSVRRRAVCKAHFIHFIHSRSDAQNFLHSHTNKLQSANNNKFYDVCDCINRTESIWCRFVLLDLGLHTLNCSIGGCASVRVHAWSIDDDLGLYNANNMNVTDLSMSRQYFC